MLEYFGLKSQYITDLVNSGHLRRGIHYLKVGRMTLIIVDKFIEWLEEKDGYVSEDTRKAAGH